MTMLQAAPVLPEPAPELHKRMAQARRYRLLSQDGLLARMIEVDATKAPSRRTVSSWENGKTSPTVEDLVLVARATGFPVAWFVIDLERPVTPHGPDDRGMDVPRQNVVSVDFGRAGLENAPQRRIA